MKNEKTKLPGTLPLDIFDEEILGSMLDNLTAVRYNTRMNEKDETEYLPCPDCDGMMDWHPNGHIASCPHCGREEIL